MGSTVHALAARAGNGLGGAGFCPRCSVMPVKVVGADGMATDSNVAPGRARWRRRRCIAMSWSETASRCGPPPTEWPLIRPAASRAGP